MGNHISHSADDGTGKVILSDGSVHEYDKPLTVAELMLDHPQQVVVEYQSNGKRPCALPADKKLEPNKVYIMLPMKRGKPAAAVLSSDQARQLLGTASKVLKSSRSSSSNSILSGTSGFVPLIARMCVARGNKNIWEGRVCTSSSMDKKTEEKPKTESAESESVLCEDIMPEYLSRQLSGKGWKPNLDTINEKSVKYSRGVRRRHWLLSF